MRKRWQIRKVNEVYLYRLMEALSIPKAMARVLLNRGITTPEAGRDFLSPSLGCLLEWCALPGVERATQVIGQAIRRNARLVIFGDYDVDGLTASAILARFLRRFSGSAEVYIPSRFVEGYGLTEQAAFRILELHPHLVIAVDCGIRDFLGAEVLKSHGVGLVIVDHHLPEGPHLPRADAIVSTFDLESKKPLSYLSGAGLAFVLVQALAKYLGVEVSPEESYLDFACLGTVSDAVPLLGENRVIAKYGLECLRRFPSSGILALLEVAGINKEDVDVHEISFILAPRINAAGRVEHPRFALELLLCEEYGEALEKARYLNLLNGRRQRDEERVFESIYGDEEMYRFLEDEIVVLVGKDWNVGVLGIVASRLSERLNRPVIVLGEKNGMAVGSGRSIEGFNLTEALGACQSLLVRYGGHEMAVGLRLKVENIPFFRERINTLFGDQVRALRLSSGLVVDAVVGLADLDREFLEFWERLKPFGEKNPNPLLATLNVALVKKSWGKGESQVWLCVSQGRERQEAVVFGGKERAGELLESSLVDLAFEVRCNASRSPYLKLHDWRIKK